MLIIRLLIIHHNIHERRSWNKKHGKTSENIYYNLTQIAKNIQKPLVKSKQVYEVDEIKSFVKCKKNLIWIVYALNRKTKEVVSYNVGNRTNAILGVVIKTLDLSKAKKIYIDKMERLQVVDQ